MQVLGVPAADVVRADDAAERAERLRGVGTEVVCLPLGGSASPWVLLIAGPSEVIRDAGAVEPVVAAAAAALAQHEALDRAAARGGARPRRRGRCRSRSTVDAS